MGFIGAGYIKFTFGIIHYSLHSIKKSRRSNEARLFL